MNNPVLSIVIIGRNDNYGGDFKNRLQRAVNYWHQQLTAHQISSEIIFVNYNPLPQPPIKDFIDWSPSNKFVELSIVQVNAEVHEQLVKEYKVKDIAVLEFIAKNIGIRRAKGEFILSTNADILVDKKMFARFKNLNSKKFYRANRFDFTSSELAVNTEDINNVTRIWLKGYYHDFTKTHNRSLQLAIAKAARLRYYADYYLKQMINPVIRKIWATDYHKKAEMSYHCHCSGDFMLMHRNAWNELRGFWERSYITLHVDGLLVIQAAALGLEEEIFSEPIYHQEHERRYNHAIDNNDYREEYLHFQEQAQQMLKNKKAIIYNSADWGLSNFALPQEKI